MKTIGFAGCSFTYGDGLDYYFGNRETSRFSHLVSSHFNVQSINQSFRGGSHTQIISWWDSFLEHQNIDAFIFQFTMWTRSDSFIIPGVSHIDMFSKHEKVFRQWSIENNISTDEYIEQAKVSDVVQVLNFLQKYEHRFPIYILCWPDTTLPYIKNHTWLTNRLIKLSYQGQTYESISDLMDNPLKPKFGLLSKMIKTSQTLFFNTGEFFDVSNTSRPELTIATDYINFKKPRKDYHPSKLCHEVIANNIIDRLTNDNLFQNN